MTFTKKISLILLITLSVIAVQAQILDSKGTISNKGVIKVKGNAFISQDTIGGRVEYLKNINSQIQIIPQIVYNEILLSGQSTKNLKATNKPLVSMGKFISDPGTDIDLDGTSPIISTGLTEHNGRVNPWYLYGSYEMQGDTAQPISGKGSFQHLMLDNVAGADVKDNGGFRVNSKLELKRGAFRNSAQSNFAVGDSATVIRHFGASISYEPSFENRVDVRFVGNGRMTSGPELPTDTTKLQKMIVENTGGLILSKSVTANDSIYVGDGILTEPDSLNKNVLTLTSQKEPGFSSNPDAEIEGSFRRTNLRFDNTRQTFNNPYTYALFADGASAGDVKHLTFRIKPRSFPPFLNGTAKVQRSYTITATDANYSRVQGVADMTVGYGFRDLPGDPTRHETNNLDITKVKYQRWDGTQWVDLAGSQPTQRNADGWVYSEAKNFNTFGEFAVGVMDILRNLLLAGDVFLEGAFRQDDKLMGTELVKKGIVPLTPPDSFPYNLDPKRSTLTVTSIPDSVVDWILIQFKSSVAGGRNQFLTAFVKADGKIVDRKGNYPIDLVKEGIDSGDYYVAIMHRNHLSIVTEDPVHMYSAPVPYALDFTKPEILMGRIDALKPLTVRDDGSLLFGMVSGDINGDGVVNDTDFITTWEDRDYEGYFRRDLNMNGIITTKDLNLTWNNRGRKSYLP